jgi:aryl-alcohol dehydrogenase-like predicted oxidoreductase
MATLPRIGLGLAALGRPGYINLGHGDDVGADASEAAMERRCHAVLDAAYANGVRDFDAARSYGRAEEFLADWLAARAIPPGAVTVSSKWGYTYTAGWRVHAERHEVKDHTLPTLQRQIGESRARLGAHLALYQIHSATLESGVLADVAVLAELARLRAGGLVIGLSLSGPAQAEALARALEVRVDGVGLFGSVQATWNLHERAAAPALARAHAAGWKVIIKEALANGRLTARGADPDGPLAQAARAAGVGPDALALAAALARPWADVVLSGAATVEQLASNLRAREVVWTPALDGALAALIEPADVYWRARAALPWT